jgi:hypothetical protein
MSNLSRLMRIASLSLLLPVLVIAQQAQERTIKKLSWPNEPVKISKLKVMGKAVGLNQKFVADDGWLRGLTISLKNTSSKTNFFIELELDVIDPDISGDNIVLAYPIAYGKMPPPGIASSSDAPKLTPNETEEVNLSDENYDVLQQLLTKVNYSKKIRHTEVVVREVVFGDDTKWAAGALFRRSTVNPNEWERIELPSSRVAKPRLENLNTSLNNFCR